MRFGGEIGYNCQAFGMNWKSDSIDLLNMGIFRFWQIWIGEVTRWWKYSLEKSTV